MYKIRVLSTAVNDFQNILFYIRYQLKNNTAAKNLNDKIQKEINNIREFPYACPICVIEGQLENEYRRSKVGNYLIYYTISELKKIIYIVRILYSRMNQNSVFQSTDTLVNAE